MAYSWKNPKQKIKNAERMLSELFLSSVTCRFVVAMVSALVSQLSEIFLQKRIATWLGGVQNHIINGYSVI